MRNKFTNSKADTSEEKEVKKNVKLKSEHFNNDNEQLEKREDGGPNDAFMWGCVLGFALFFTLLICIIVFTN